MSDDIAVIVGILLLLWLGGVIGWWLSSKVNQSRYKELLDASIEVNKVTMASLEKSMREIKERKDKQD